MKCLLPFILLVLLSSASPGQPVDSARIQYRNCLDTLQSILRDNGSFKKAVFLTENCFFEGAMQYTHFEDHIDQLVYIIRLLMQANPLVNYHYSDSINVHINFAIFKFLKDTTRVMHNSNKYYLLPYTYDFDDFFGQEHWNNMFVSKLLATHKGNCHSLPYLYKILSDELGATSWLSLAPNHTYITNRCKKIGWYNTELTSGEFPVDAWIMASGYIPLDAVRSGIYMDTLSNQQALALCVLDLAKGYEHKTKNYTDGFILQCCDLSLQYFPRNTQALLLKVETLKHVYEEEVAGKAPAARNTFQEMEAQYVRLYNLGYREMPPKMYMEWLQSVIKERDKYINLQATATFIGK